MSEIERGGIDVTEENEISWINSLSDFDEKVWPLFEKHGYTKDAAHLMWFLNRVVNKLDEVVDVLESELS